MRTSQLGRLLSVWMLCAFGAGCTTMLPPGTSGADGGVDGGRDGAALDGGSCANIGSRIQDWISSHQSCVADSDCDYPTTACGLPSACGAVMAKSGDSGLQSLVEQYRNAGCAGSGSTCACSLLYPLLACSSGTCGIKH